MYSGRQKLDFGKRLDNWQQLAMYFEIPEDQLRRFKPGDEPYDIWEWLKARNRLAELPEALTYIDRADIVRDVLLPPPTPPASPQITWHGSPYPGLRYFTPDDAPIFFGRTRETDELLYWLQRQRFVAVVGASGSGKSSLVAADVLPRLHELPGGQAWQWFRFTPGGLGDDPFVPLAAELARDLERHGLNGRAIADKLRANGDLASLAAMLLTPHPAEAELLLFIDQFEELFTLTQPTYQRRFIAMLARAARSPRLRMVLTLRADFYHRCVDFSPLAALLRTGSFPLAAPDMPALLEMITGPAAVAGLRFEEDLPGRILRDTGSEPGSLALMAFALKQLYDTRSKRTGQLTHLAYEAFAGVQGAIAKQAEDTFRTLDAQTQAKLGDVFREMVEVDEQSTATRRRAPLDQLTSSEAAKTLIQAFTDARLLVTDRTPDNVTMVEVAHEALFRSWPRLREWIQATADDHRLRRQIAHGAAYWVEHGCQERHRWPDVRVTEVVAMFDHLGITSEDLSERERSFVGPLDCERMLAALDDPATGHEQRALIGVRLALLGDPRPGVGLCADGVPDIVWCQVPGGEVTLEEHEGTFRVAACAIAKYPITVGQFRPFVEAPDGFHQAAWWHGLPYTQPEAPGKRLGQYDNHPVVYVAWAEAVAFCKWLSARLGYEVRLPTEWEWQQAATGGDTTNVYPWGEEWREAYANTYESNLGRTTAVGLYPRGASPLGALDMSGNVWEWCLNEHKHPERMELSSDVHRVVRGGSWGYGRDFARGLSERVRHAESGRQSWVSGSAVVLHSYLTCLSTVCRFNGNAACFARCRRFFCAISAPLPYCLGRFRPVGLPGGTSSAFGIGRRASAI